MHRVARRVCKALAVVALICVPLAAHLAVITHRGVVIAGLLIALQAALVAWVSLSLAIPKTAMALRLAATAAVFAATSALLLRDGDGLILAAAVPHAIAYLGLLTVFAASLAPGQTPLITIVASRARGPLDATLLAYTRRVTIAWCFFFAAQLALSLGLFLLAPRDWWSVFVNLCTLPMVGLMFAAELCVRHWRHGIHRPTAGTGRVGHAMQLLGQLRVPVRQAEP